MLGAPQSLVASKSEPVQSKNLDISKQNSLLLKSRAETRALKEPPGRSNPSCFQLDFLQEQKTPAAGAGWLGHAGWKEQGASQPPWPVSSVSIP